MRRAYLALGIAAAIAGGTGCGGGTTLDVDAGSDAAMARLDASPDTGPTCAGDEDCDDGDLCNGVEACASGACTASDEEDDGATCDLDADATTPDLCVSGECRAARCGDEYVDATAGEECDDGNGVRGDGCDDCSFTCEADTECSDGNDCNGAETCSAAHVCMSGTPLAEDSACASATGACVGGTCLARTCTMATDCDDGNPCNGTETCEGADGCAAGTTLDCDDTDACTTDTCNLSGGCAHALIDLDLDGYSPASLGECGDDCDDTDAEISPDAVDICGDGIDNNCDGTIDEGAATAWYADCDDDGYAATGARTVTSCVEPAAGTSMCTSGGGWTTRAPTTSADCNDGNAAVNPGQSMYQSTAIAGAAPASDYDYDCNASEDRGVTADGGCVAVGLGGCELTEGWAAAAPACGAEGGFVVRCERAVLGSCNEVTETRVQSCR